jgi:hypothetical protein
MSDHPTIASVLAGIGMAIVLPLILLAPACRSVHPPDPGARAIPDAAPAPGTVRLLAESQGCPRTAESDLRICTIEVVRTLEYGVSTQTLAPGARIDIEWDDRSAVASDAMEADDLITRVPLEYELFAERYRSTDVLKIRWRLVRVSRPTDP